ncbi:hypothetical protein MD484_g3035, partial [Candolleomyces efflorescens]
MVSTYLTIKEMPFIGRGRSSVPDFILDYKEVKSNFQKHAKKAELEMEAPSAVEQPNGMASIQKIWSDLKKTLLQDAQNFAKKRSSRLDEQIKKWENRRSNLLNQPNPDDETQFLLDEIEANLKELEAAKILRKRTNIAARHHLLGETNSKFDYILSKELKPRDTIYCLKKPNTQPPEYEKCTKHMVEIATSHHETLQMDPTWDPESTEAEDQMNGIVGLLRPRLSINEKEAIGANFTEEEVARAIQHAANGKAAGLDGIPAEVWKFFLKTYEDSEPQEDQAMDGGGAGIDPREQKERPPNIARMLTLVFNDITRNGVQAGTEFSEGWMCPIYKKKDRDEREVPEKWGHYMP